MIIRSIKLLVCSVDMFSLYFEKYNSCCCLMIGLDEVVDDDELGVAFVMSGIANDDMDV